MPCMLSTLDPAGADYTTIVHSEGTSYRESHKLQKVHLILLNHYFELPLMACIHKDGKIKGFKKLTTFTKPKGPLYFAYGNP